MLITLRAERVKQLNLSVRSVVAIDKGPYKGTYNRSSVD